MFYGGFFCLFSCLNNFQLSVEVIFLYFCMIYDFFV